MDTFGSKGGRIRFLKGGHFRSERWTDSVQRWIFSVSSMFLLNENQGTIDMRFDPFLKPFLLQLKKEFTKFELKNVMTLKSGNSIRLYELLKQYLVIGERQIDIEELKEYMGIGKDGYQKYADFKRKVIAVAEKEINEKTDIIFQVKEMKQGRRVAALSFFIKPKKEVVERQNELTPIEGEQEDWFEEYEKENNEEREVKIEKISVERRQEIEEMVKNLPRKTD